MLPSVLQVSAAAARRFMRRALALDRPHASVAEALAHHGYVQIDPINVCGRMHDLNLRNRVAGYREGDLLLHLYGPDPATTLAPAARKGFEHYVGGVLTALPLEAWPHLVADMKRRAGSRGGYFGRLAAAEERLARRILDEIADRGPLTSDDVQHDARATSNWGGETRQVKTVLEKLLLHGRVVITTRRAFRRVYDLPERVLPRAVLSREPHPSRDSLRWQVLLRLRQRRLVALRRQDVPLVADLVHPVQVEAGRSLYCLRADLPLWTDVETDLPAPRALTLLAPLDPLIYDRRVTRLVWDFDYTWEVYTPAGKRRRGYYALPILSGAELVGHVDLKADRAERRLRVVSRRTRRGHATAEAVAQLATFLGLRVR